MVTDGSWTYCADNFIMCKNIELLCWIPETNIKLYANYNSIKKGTKQKVRKTSVTFHFDCMEEGLKYWYSNSDWSQLD